MIDPKYRTVLECIFPLLSEEPPLPWVITGSLGFALQGLEVEVQDVDIQTDRAGAYEVERRLSSHVVRPVAWSESGRIRSHFGALEIGGVKVEIMGDLQKRMMDGRWEEPVDVIRNRRWVMWQGLRLPVLSLEYEYQAYRILGRAEKAETLKKWLENHP